jgi:hypothetical protein
MASCGASDGQAYYPKFGLAALSKDHRAEWTSDTIGNGRISLSETDGEFDILVSDTVGGRVFSSRQEGAKVIVTDLGDKSISLLVAYPLLVETYTFFRNAEGQAEVMWTSNKWGTPIPKVGAYRAACSFFAR